MNFGLTYLDEADFQERILNSYKKIKNNKKLRKYYWKRYQLFTKFDDGILLDSKESWYSVTPEKVAEHIALKCFTALDCNPNLVVLDAFAGCGGNTIQFAKYFNRVYALDIDMNKLLCAKINSRIYKCQDRIELICEDFFDFARNYSAATNENHIKPDLVFLSPPWGGVNYMNEYPDEIDLTRFPLDGVRIFEMALKLCTNIVYFLPRNCNIENCVDLMRQLIKDNRHRVIELEQNFLDYKLVAISAYYGDLVQMKIKK